MAVTFTIDALAVANLVAAINGVQVGETVTTPGGTFEFQTSLTATLYSANGQSVVEGLAWVIQGKDVPLPNQPHRKDDFWVPLVIACAATATGSTEQDAPSVEDKLRQINADIRLALGVDVSRGGYAINTIFDDASEYDLTTDPPMVYVLLKLHVRTAFNNRYAQ